MEEKAKVRSISIRKLHNLCCGAIFSVSCFDLRRNPTFGVPWAQKCNKEELLEQEKQKPGDMIVIIHDNEEEAVEVGKKSQSKCVNIYCGDFEGGKHLLLPNLQKYKLPKWIASYERLFLGGIATARHEETLKAMKITHVINASNERFYTKYNGIKYLDVDVWDKETSDLMCHFDSCCEFEKHSEGGRCYVHCSAGVSRSATIILAILIKNYKLTLEQAWIETASCKNVEPNNGFVMQLVKWEKLVHGKNVCDITKPTSLRNVFTLPNEGSE